jgi:WD40 repeat protein
MGQTNTHANNEPKSVKQQFYQLYDKYVLDHFIIPQTNQVQIPNHYSVLKPEMKLEPICSIAHVGDNYVATGHYDGTAAVWSVTEGEVIATFNSPIPQCEIRYLCAVTRDIIAIHINTINFQYIHFFNWRQSKLLYEMKHRINWSLNTDDNGGTCNMFSIDDQFMVVGFGNSVVVWKITYNAEGIDHIETIKKIKMAHEVHLVSPILNRCVFVSCLGEGILKKVSLETGKKVELVRDNKMKTSHGSAKQINNRLFVLGGKNWGGQCMRVYDFDGNIIFAHEGHFCDVVSITDNIIACFVNSNVLFFDVHQRKIINGLTVIDSSDKNNAQRMAYTKSGLLFMVHYSDILVIPLWKINRSEIMKDMMMGCVSFSDITINLV